MLKRIFTDPYSVFLVVVYCGILVTLFISVDSQSNSVSDTLYGFLVPFVVLTAVLAVLLYRMSGRGRS